MFPQPSTKNRPLFIRFKNTSQATHVLHVDSSLKHIDGSTIRLSRVISTIFNVWWPVSMFTGNSHRGDNRLDGSFEIRYDVRRDLLQTLASQWSSIPESAPSFICSSYATDDPEFYFHYKDQRGEKAVCADPDPDHPSYLKMKDLAKNIIKKGHPLPNFHKVLVVIGNKSMVKILGKPGIFAGARQYHGVAKIYIFKGIKYAILDHANNYYDDHFLAYKLDEIPDAPYFSTLQEAFLSIYNQKYPAVTFAPSSALDLAVKQYVGYQKKLWLRDQIQPTRRLESNANLIVKIIEDCQKEILFIPACLTLIEQFNKGIRIKDMTIEMIPQLPLIMRRAFLTTLSQKSSRSIKIKIRSFYHERIHFIEEKIDTNPAEVIHALQAAIQARQNFKQQCKINAPHQERNNLSNCCLRWFSIRSQSPENGKNNSSPVGIQVITPAHSSSSL